MHQTAIKTGKLPASSVFVEQCSCTHLQALNKQDGFHEKGIFGGAASQHLGLSVRPSARPSVRQFQLAFKRWNARRKVST